MNNPLVSILMPVKNTGIYTKKAIESILSQTYNNFELIMLDSSDDNITSDIIKSFSDKRIVYYYYPEFNLPQILNFGLNVSRGKIIARMDGDDISLENRLQIEIDFLIAHPDIDIIGTQFNNIDENDKFLYRKNLPVEHSDIEFMMPIIPSILHPTIVTYKDNFFNAGLYDETRILSEDTELFLRMLKIGLKFHNIDIPLYSYRITNKSDELYKRQNEFKYKDCINYINSFYPVECFDFNLRRGLLEYYIGDVSIARHYFFRSIKFDLFKSIKYWRYYFLSLLGNDFMQYIRRKKISFKLNRFLLKLFKYDTYKVKR